MNRPCMHAQRFRVYVSVANAQTHVHVSPAPVPGFGPTRKQGRWGMLGWCPDCGSLLYPGGEWSPGAGGIAPSEAAASTPNPAAGRPGTPTPTAPEAPPLPSKAPLFRCIECSATTETPLAERWLVDINEYGAVLGAKCRTCFEAPAHPRA